MYYDPAAYSRFLLAVPLLIVAEVVIGRRIAEAASQFITSGLIREDQYSDFDDAIAAGLRLRNSTVAEIIIVAITYVGAFESLRIFSSNVSTWTSLASESAHRFTLAGYWYALVSLPIFQFLVYRWLWTTIIWCRFLWRVSKLDLQLVPTHPDQAGGLGFWERHTACLRSSVLPTPQQVLVCSLARLSLRKCPSRPLRFPSQRSSS